MIFVNFKSYPNVVGLIKIIQDIAASTPVKIIPVIKPEDIAKAASSNFEVWTQRFDSAIKGAVGTFLNHSEAKLPDFDTLRKTHQTAVSLGIKTLIFADNIFELKRITELKPDIVAYEPPELIGSKEKSVASENPDIIKKATEICQEFNIPLIVGAGIHSKEDVKKSLEMGAVGVAVSSFVVNAEDKNEALRELISGFPG